MDVAQRDTHTHTENLMLKPKHSMLAGPDAISLLLSLPTPGISGLWLGPQELRPWKLGSGVCWVLLVPKTGA